MGLRASFGPPLLSNLKLNIFFGGGSEMSQIAKILTKTLLGLNDELRKPISARPTINQIYQK
jgi:hypothetical protein